MERVKLEKIPETDTSVIYLYHQPPQHPYDRMCWYQLILEQLEKRHKRPAFWFDLPFNLVLTYPELKLHQ